MKKAINRGREEKRKQVMKKRIRNIGVSVAAVLALTVILPNTSQEIANAMGKIPILGNVFKVLTIRDYQYDDGHNSAKVEVPEVSLENGEDSEAASQVNKSVQEYTDELLKNFEEDMIETGEGYKDLNITYDVVTNTDNWFTLKINVLETMASGHEVRVYYHINKETDQVMQLKDLFATDSDYITAISENIKEQMTAQNEEYGSELYWIDNKDYPESNFKEIKANQNFYYNEEGNLVIVFDEAEVAAAYAGSPEFVIPDEILEGI